MSYIDVTGKTEDDAIQSALAELGCTREQVSVEILERAKSGFLGIGGQRLPKPVVTGVFAVNTSIHQNSAVVVSIPLFNQTHQFLALFVGFEVKVFQFIDITISRQRNIGLDARVRHGFSGGTGVVIQVGNGSNAKTQAFCNGQFSSSLRGTGVHFIFLVQLLLQSFRTRQIIH